MGFSLGSEVYGTKSNFSSGTYDANKIGRQLWRPKGLAERVQLAFNSLPVICGTDTTVDDGKYAQHANQTLADTVGLGAYRSEYKCDANTNQRETTQESDDSIGFNLTALDFAAYFHGESSLPKM